MRETAFDSEPSPNAELPRSRTKDGAIKGINLAARLRDAKSLLAGAKEDVLRASNSEKTDFSEFNATFAIKDGVARIHQHPVEAYRVYAAVLELNIKYADMAA